MNTSQEQLQCLLTIAIHGGIPSSDLFLTINGEELFNLALQQGVSSILYPTLMKYCNEVKIDQITMSRWKDSTLYMGARQVRMMSGIKKILSLFELNGIPTISVKGLVLRQLYPQPELRIMSDIDLLIEEKDMEKSIQLLFNLGYHPSSKDLNNPKYIHIKMKKNGALSIELHRTLWSMRTKVIDDQIWLNHIWQNKRIAVMEGFDFSALSLEDEFINIIVHLARHLIVTGARLRQLCDFVLFINNHWNKLDVEYIDKILELMNLYEFYKYLLSASHYYLGLEIPKNCTILDRSKSETLLDLIYTSTTQPPIVNEITSRRKVILELGRQCLRKLKVIVKNSSFITLVIKLLKPFTSRHRSLSGIGLNIKY